MANYLPSADNALNVWATNFSSYVSANATAIGLTSSDATALATKLAAFAADLTAHTTAIAAAKAVRQTKQTDRRALTNDVRALVKRIQSNPTTTNTQREALGITVPAPGPTPVPAPTTIPTAQLEKNGGLQQVLRLVDSGTSKRKRPTGAIGAEVYLSVATSTPAGVDQLQLKDINTSTKVIQEFTSADAGKTAYYAFRWINPRGERGPWSDITSVTIAA